MKLILFLLLLFLEKYPIIKNQYVYNIIKMNIPGFTYVNFASFPNGDLIFETTKNPYSPNRFFIGYKKDGRGYFKNSQTNKEEYYYSTIIED